MRSGVYSRVGIVVISLQIFAASAMAESRTLTNRRPSKSEIICRQSFPDWKRDFGYAEARRIQQRCYVWRHGHGVAVFRTMDGR